MSPNSGVTHEQFEAAVDRSMDQLRAIGVNGPREDQQTLMGVAAMCLVPPDHRIVGPDQIEALRRVKRDYARLAACTMRLREFAVDPCGDHAEVDALIAALETQDADLATIAALIGDADAPAR